MDPMTRGNGAKVLSPMPQSLDSVAGNISSSIPDRIEWLNGRLPYFVSWGGIAATALMSEAFDKFLGYDFSGQRVLEIGSGPGKMSCLFAVLGAEVTAVDVDPDSERRINDESMKWGVEGKINFVHSRAGPAA